MKTIGSLAKNQPVTVSDETDADALAFAKAYLAAQRETRTPKATLAFATRYTKLPGGRHGFGGSGWSAYKDADSGRTFRVDRIANGRTFWGTDHYITPVVP